jgi:spermidine synthase
VQPWHALDRATAPDGTELVLARRGDEWVVRAGGRVLVSSRTHASEDALAEIALDRWRSVERRVGGGPRTVLLGGIGLGFTLRALLDRVPSEARVIVAELVPELAGWIRGTAAHLADRPLEDPRVRLQIGDVLARVDEAKGAFDLIVLDVDNGPSPLVHRANRQLYQDAGVMACHQALRAGGVLAVWSAGSDRRYLERLERAGFSAGERMVSAAPHGGVRHVIMFGVKAARRQG